MWALVKYQWKFYASGENTRAVLILLPAGQKNFVSPLLENNRIDILANRPCALVLREASGHGRASIERQGETARACTPGKGGQRSWRAEEGLKLEPSYR